MPSRKIRGLSPNFPAGHETRSSPIFLQDAGGGREGGGGGGGGGQLIRTIGLPYITGFPYIVRIFTLLNVLL